MILLPIDEVKPGMTLATTLRVQRGRKDLVVVTPKHPLKEKDIEILKTNYGISYLWVNSTEMVDLRSMINDRFEEQHSTMMGSLVDDLMVGQHQFASKTKDKAETLYRADKYARAIESLIESFIDDKKKLSLLTAINSGGVKSNGAEIGEDASSHLGRYSANVSSLAAALASALKNRIFLHKKEAFRNMHYKSTGGLVVFNVYEDMKAIALAGLFCDVGLTAEEFSGIVNRRGHWTPEEEKLARHHVKAGVGIMKDAHASAIVLATILQSHQTWCGTGYPNLITGPDGVPRPREGKEIHLYARILKIVMDYVDLITYANLSPVTALNRMRTEFAHHYDPSLKQEFDKIMMPFPIGEKVILNNGLECLVVDFHPDNPCRPTVNVLAAPTERSKDLIGLDINLSDERFRGLIVSEYRGQDVSRDLFEMGNFERTFLTDIERVKDMKDASAGKYEPVFVIAQFSPQDGRPPREIRGTAKNLTENTVVIAAPEDAGIEKNARGTLAVLWVTGEKKVVLSLRAEAVSLADVPDGAGEFRFGFRPPANFDTARAVALLEKGLPQFGDLVLKKELPKTAMRIMDPFFNSLENTFMVRARIEVERDAVRALDGGRVAYPDVVAFMNVSGHLKGAIAISMPRATLDALILRMRPGSPLPPDRERREMFTEIVNFFAGIAVQEFGRECIVIQIKMPRIVSDANAAPPQLPACDIGFSLAINSSAGPLALDLVLDQT